MSFLFHEFQGGGGGGGGARVSFLFIFAHCMKIKMSNLYSIFGTTQQLNQGCR